MGILDSLKDAGSSLGQGLLGTTEKAIIRIADERPKDKEVKLREGPTPSFGFDSNMDVAANLQQAQALSNVPGDAGAAFSEIAQGLESNANYDKEFKVQFNPSTLSLSGFVESETLNMDFSSKDGDELKSTGMSLQLHMSVQLIFDQVSPRMAFGEDLINISPSSLLKSGVSTLISKTAYKRTNSVQTEVEGFLAACNTTRTKKIQFAWGQMEYSGILRNVNAKYTMFDMSGCPVRAVVNLSIFLIDPHITRTDQGYWGKAYKKMFDPANRNLELSNMGTRIMKTLNIE